MSTQRLKLHQVRDGVRLALLATAAVAALGGLAACGSSSGGGGVPFSGGVAGTQCDAALQGQGCLATTAGFSVMQCTGGLWTQIGTCTSPQYCAEEGSGAQRTAGCKSAAGADATAGGDTGAGADSAAGGDTSVLDVSVIDPDSSGGPDSGSKDTGGGSKDTAGNNDVAAGLCGNLQCEGGEDPETCFIDCGDEPKCVWQACPSEKAACLANSSCIGGLLCISECADDACFAACAQQFPNLQTDLADINACAESSGCDQGGGSTDGSCADSCTDGDNGGCYCSDDCVEFGDCCEDYNQFCGGGGGGSTDGSCADSCTDGDNGGCYCDTDCTEFEDCCPDYQQFCAAP